MGMPTRLQTDDKQGRVRTIEHNASWKRSAAQACTTYALRHRQRTYTLMGSHWMGAEATAQ
eukprot:1705351-Alexandrium_andersonii.AAC.1